MVRTFKNKSEYVPVKKINEDFYKICWDYLDMKDPVIVDDKPTGEYKETDLCTFIYENIHHKPTLDEIKNLIISWHNLQIDLKILSGFVWNDMPVWLSTENQFNYKAAYDLAVQTQGASLPVTFKFGTTFDPVYHTFTNLEEFTEFYFASIQYINEQLAAGWAKKDAIDWDTYKIDE